MLPDAEDIITYITERYETVKKIVEVGVGRLPLIAVGLKRRLPNTEVVVTDVNEQALDEVRRSSPELEVVYDDAFDPDLTLYKGSSLIYLIRPPPELQIAAVEIARRVGSDVIIRPLGGDCCVAGRHFRHFRLVNFRKTIFYYARFTAGEAPSTWSLLFGEEAIRAHRRIL